MPRFVPDHVKTEMTCGNANKKFLFIIKHVLDWYKNQEMCDKVILENGGMLMFVPDSNEKICNKSIINV